MKAKILFALGSVSLNAQEVGNSSNSESTTQLEGDLNHDNKVDVADVTYLVNIIMKNQSEAKDGMYYWYIGVENPSSISNIQTDNTKPGWHEIGETTEGFIHDMNNRANWIKIVTKSNPTENDMIPYYIVVPIDMDIVSVFGTDLTSNGQLRTIECNISGYKAFVSNETYINVKGLILKGNNQGNNDNDDYYWYIGVENPSSISNIQTDNTKPGWHSIGSSLTGFVLDTDTNPIVLSTTTDKYAYYVVIPTALNMYDADGASILYGFTQVICNISGYKAYQYNSQTRKVKGIYIK